MHTVYGGAHLFKSDSAQTVGRACSSLPGPVCAGLSCFCQSAGTARSRPITRSSEEADAITAQLESDPDAARRENKPAWLAHTIYKRVNEKLRREPVEDFRIDFEDGYGNRPDEEEDGHAASAAAEVAEGMTRRHSAAVYRHSHQDLFTKNCASADAAHSISSFQLCWRSQAASLPENFVVTLPKITIPEQVSALVDIFELLENKNGLAAGSLKMEMMIETTQSIINAQGDINLPLLLAAARGRCVAAHFGTYDYTASCSITAAHQHMMHPACDFAKHMMQVSFARHRHLAFRRRHEHHAGRAASICGRWCAFDPGTD